MILDNNTINIRDIVRYSTPINPQENWGAIVEILKVEDSINQYCKGITLYRVNPLDPKLGHEFIEERSIIQAYSMYYEGKMIEE